MRTWGKRGESRHGELSDALSRAVDAGAAHTAAEQESAPTRHRTVYDTLKAGGWKLERQKKHLVYSRTIVMGLSGSGGVQRQT